MLARLTFHQHLRWLLVAAMVLLLPLYKGGTPAMAQALASGLAGLLAVSLAWDFPFARRELLYWALPWLVLSLIALYPPGMWFGYELALPPLAHRLSWWAFLTIYWLAMMSVAKLPGELSRALVLVIAALAVFEAIYGVASVLGERADTILGVWEREHGGGNATGTFVNRNHYANMLGTTWMLGFALLAAPQLRHTQIEAWRRFVLVLFSLILALALLVSNSRMGVGVAGIGFLALSLFFRRGPSSHLQRIGRWNIVVLAAVVFFGLWFGLAPLLARFLALPENVHRYEIWGAMLDLPWKAWLLGIGPGNFTDVYKLVQPAHHGPETVFAHNDYLEFILEIGLIGVVVLTAAVSTALRHLWPERLGPLQLGAAAAVVVMLVHSLADFSMQIPGAAVMFWVAMGLLLNRELALRA